MNFLGFVGFYSIQRYHANGPSYIGERVNTAALLGYCKTSQNLDVPSGQSLKLQKECQDDIRKCN